MVILIENEIPLDTAIDICNLVYERMKKKKISFMKYQCIFCRLFGKKDYNKYCFHSKANNSGCGLVNKEFKKNL